MIHWYQSQSGSLFKVDFSGSGVKVCTIRRDGTIGKTTKTTKDKWLMGKSLLKLSPMNRRQRLFLDVVTSVNEVIANVATAKMMAEF